MAEKDYDLLVIGELCVDLIIHGEDLMPRFGQAEQLVDDAALVLGSSSAILACGVAQLGLKVAFAGKVGRDAFGNFVQQELGERGVQLDGLVVDPQVCTGITLHLAHADDRAMFTYLGSMAHFSLTEVDPALLRRARHVHVSSYYLQPAIHHDLPGLFESLRARGVTTSLDPGYDPSGKWEAGLQAVLPYTDIFMPNRTEALGITGSQNLAEVVRSLPSGTRMAVVKEGSRGATAYLGAESIHQPAFVVPSIDSTGAGDNFNAGFLYGRLNGWDIQECLRWGCACGALATLAVGGVTGQKTSAEVSAWMASAAQAQ